MSKSDRNDNITSNPVSESEVDSRVEEDHKDENESLEETYNDENEDSDNKSNLSNSTSVSEVLHTIKEALLVLDLGIIESLRTSCYLL